MGTLASHAELAGLNTLTDVRAHVGCGDRLWQSVTDQLGDPGDNVLLVAALPQHVLIQACGNAETTPGVGLTPFQATHVGLVWRICRKIVHMRAGQPEGDFTDLDPWTPSTPSTSATTTSAPASTGHSVKERVLKMSSLVDQADDSELLPPEKSMVDGWVRLLMKKRNQLKVSWRSYTKGLYIGTGPVRGFRSLVAFWQADSEKPKISAISAAGGRELSYEGAPRPTKPPAVVSVLACV